MRLAVLSLSLIAALASTPALADLKVGYVDLQRALQEVSEGQAAKFKLKSEIDKRKAEFETEQKKLREDGMVLDRQASAMSEEVRIEKMKQLQGRLMQISEKGQKLQVEFVEKERTELKKIFDKMDPIVAAIAKREGLAMVFEKTDSGLVFAESNLDVTNELVRTYNEKFPVKGVKTQAVPATAPKDAPTK
ncbi:MAG: OmpH family outer membrane protein [Archangium sp.]|nr:OmpH family outer membrane protein [Archangium sp.]MDP3151181.1 OmpH family outer membrane protein [Archangium sp.]MDP3570178.1 OmpH family outer membrane protein [Archangium sp.]